MSEINKLQNAEGAEETENTKNELNQESSIDETSTETSKPLTEDNTVSEEVTIDTENSETEPPQITEETQETSKTKNEKKSSEDDEVINEIEESNAEDAEDEGNKDRHTIEVKEYDSMSLEALAIEFEKLLEKEKVQAIKSHVNNINDTFKTKLQAIIDEKKEEFINDGGNEIDFYYSSPIQKRFKESYVEVSSFLNLVSKTFPLQSTLSDKITPPGFSLSITLLK